MSINWEQYYLPQKLLRMKIFLCKTPRTMPNPKQRNVSFFPSFWQNSLSGWYNTNQNVLQKSQSKEAANEKALDLVDYIMTEFCCPFVLRWRLDAWVIPNICLFGNTKMVIWIFHFSLTHMVLYKWSVSCKGEGFSGSSASIYMSKNNICLNHLLKR